MPVTLETSVAFVAPASCIRRATRANVGWLFVVLAVFCMGALSGCDGSGKSTGSGGGGDAAADGAGVNGGGESLEHVTLQLNWVAEPQFGGFYAAEVIGAYEAMGFHCEVKAGGSGAPTVQQVGLGQIPFGIAAGDQVALARSKGLDVVAVYAVFQTSPRAIMAHASKGFGSLDEVLNSDVTLAMESGPLYRQFLDKNYDLTTHDIVPYAGAMERFTTDDNFAMQCFAISEPITARQRGVETAVFPVAEAGYNPYVTVLITSGKLLNEKPEMVARFVAAVNAGWTAYMNDPAPANVKMRSLNESMSAPTFVAAAKAQQPLIQTEHTKVHGLGHMTQNRWETLVQQLIDLDAIEADEAPTFSSCYRVVLTPKVVADAAARMAGDSDAAMIEAAGDVMDATVDAADDAVEELDDVGAADTQPSF